MQLAVLCRAVWGNLVLQHPPARLTYLCQDMQQHMCAVAGICLHLHHASAMPRTHVNRGTLSVLLVLLCGYTPRSHDEYRHHKSTWPRLQ
jgi:hypothetical protein